MAARPRQNHKRRDASTVQRPTSTKSIPSGSERPSAPDCVGPVLRSWWTVVGLLALSGGMLCVIFPPHRWWLPSGWWPLAYVCLVPWLVVVGATENPRRVYVGSYLMGLAMFLVNVRWLTPVTVEGYIALAAYLAIYFPLMACPLRHAVRRRGIPLVIAVPVVWVGNEFVRALALTGFPWFYLGHTQYEFRTLIQISDLVGAYGVSFLVAAVNGLLAAWFLGRGAADGPAVRRRWRGGLIAVALMILATVIYGQIQLRRDTSTVGPLVAVFQRDFPHFVERRGNTLSPTQQAQAYFDLVEQVSNEPIDIYLFPETPWPMRLNPEFRNLDTTSSSMPDRLRRRILESQYFYNQFHRLAREREATVVVGAIFQQNTPLDLFASIRQHNSAFIFRPDGGEPDRYDKVHCVFFGEVVPFRYGHLRFLYLWLNDLMPFGRGGYEYSLTPGTEFKLYSTTPRSPADRSYRFGVPICYEDVMPYISREFVTTPDGAKQADFLLNISNDGWFIHSDELSQHLAICAFRAVENRVGIARAVNTGISGFIDPNGRIYKRVTVDGVAQGAGIEGVRVANLILDSRQSLYSRIGDLFAKICTATWILLYIDYLLVRSLGRRRGASKGELTQ